MVEAETQEEASPVLPATSVDILYWQTSKMVPSDLHLL